MNKFINLSTYKFAALSDLKPLRAKLLEQCKIWQIKGTILLSTEGINLFVAGHTEQTDSLIELLKSLPGLEGLTPKRSESDHQPFTRMLVRIKKEIIAFGVEGIDPAKRTSPKLPPKELKKWLDEGKKITLLDTRNDYEIKLGTFANALPIGIKHFREFPQAVLGLPETMRDEAVVMFCTGGIRCEKAGPYLESQGFKHVFQLDGGILKYFEEVGSTHYNGDCFVFDQRVGVDPSLQETSSAQCFVCLTPLTEADQIDFRYARGVSCQFCFKTGEQKMKESIQARHLEITKFAEALPGSAPYDHKRPLKVSLKFEGKTLIEFLCGILRHISEETWREEIAGGKMLGPEFQIAAVDSIVHSGDRFYHLSLNQSEPPVNAKVRIHYEDEVMIVLEKPAPLPVHACGRFSRNTLKALLDRVYAPQKPLPAHRLDANTTGLMLVARTRHFAGMLQPQFSSGEVEKRYFARVLGHPPQDQFICELPLGEETRELGAREADENGLASTTRFKVLERFSDGTSLLEVWPLTGRTNQIRIHLWELGWPICGEQLYLPQRKLGDVQTGEVEDAPLCLHAKSISFTHPLTKKRMCFESEKVEWLHLQGLNPSSHTSYVSLEMSLRI